MVYVHKMCHLINLCIILLFLMAETKGFGYGSLCRNFPFAPKCLGVAAKRSTSQYAEKDRQSLLDIYSTLIKGVLEAERRRKENYLQKESTNIYQDDDNTILDELASSLTDNSHRQLKRETYIDSRDTWLDGFNEGRNSI